MDNVVDETGRTVGGAPRRIPAFAFTWEKLLTMLGLSKDVNLKLL
ncbi:hypothetical protein [Paenibacillus melissococcoides]